MLTSVLTFPSRGRSQASAPEAQRYASVEIAVVDIYY